jgi:hypothetical protein
MSGAFLIKRKNRWEKGVLADLVWFVGVREVNIHRARKQTGGGDVSGSTKPPAPSGGRAIRRAFGIALQHQVTIRPNWVGGLAAWAASLPGARGTIDCGLL